MGYTHQQAVSPAGGSLFRGLLSELLAGPLLQTLVGPPYSRSGFGPLWPLPFASADGTDGSMAHKKFFPREQLADEPKEEFSELTIQAAVASVGGTWTCLGRTGTRTRGNSSRGPEGRQRSCRSHNHSVGAGYF